ncbi:MAG: hypothetical protein ACREEM_31565, partial [Blastocatellia bacterium]
RYELQTRQREEKNRQAFFDYTPGSPTYGMLAQSRDGGHRERTFSNLDKNNFAPRLSLAWQLDQKTVLRGGFGIFYGGVGWYGMNFSGGASPPYLVSTAINSPTTVANTNLKLSDGFPANALDPARVVNPELFGQSQDFPYSETYQGTIDLQRELWGGAVLSVAYVGSGTAKLRLTETKRLELRGEFFNLTNTAHFGRPNAIIGSPQAGRITGTTVPNRQVQIGLRLVF